MKNTPCDGAPRGTLQTTHTESKNAHFIPEHAFPYGYYVLHPVITMCTVERGNCDKELRIGVNKIKDHLIYDEIRCLSMRTLTKLAVFAIIAGALTIAAAGSTISTSVVAQTDNATMAGNMTGGNMTAGNSTEATGQISGKGR